MTRDWAWRRIRDRKLARASREMAGDKPAIAAKAPKPKPEPKVEPMDDRHHDIELFAWIGEDELGSGAIGLKQSIAPAGFIPLVAVDVSKVNRVAFREAMTQQARIYGKTIRLCRFQYAGDVIVIDPAEL